MLITLLSVFFGRRVGVLVMAWCMSFVQLLDAWIGLVGHNPFETYGPLAFAIINCVLAYSLWKETQEGA
ncbi:hypothetical protein [Silvibacterium acidisoli]|uniref:hypothetical protein n=1 Tax=Acidobacteriaceae bacterium ZG23-2 TaxID=2883246 RepID=UPI00406D21EC